MYRFLYRDTKQSKFIPKYFTVSLLFNFFFIFITNRVQIKPNEFCKVIFYSAHLPSFYINLTRFIPGCIFIISQKTKQPKGKKSIYNKNDR